MTSAALFALLGSSTARAEQPPPAAAALFKEGRELLRANKLQDALDRFTQSEQLNPAVGTLFNIAECQDGLGKPATALQTYIEAQKLAVQKHDPRVADANERIAAFDLKVPRLSINVAQNHLADVSVVRNGQKLDPAALNIPVPIDPGHYTIEASEPGKKTWSTAIDIAGQARLSVAVPELDDDNGAAPPPPSPPTTSNTQRNLGIGLEIGGGAITALGLVFGGLAMGDWGSVTKVCPNAHCPSEAARQSQASDANSARTFSTLSTVALIAGPVLLAGGVVLHLTAPKHEVAIAPSAGSSAVGLSLTLTE